MCDTSRDLPTLWRLENAFWSPLKNFLVNRKEGTKAKDQWRMLILPAAMAGFGTGRYTMCDLDPVEVA